MTKTWWPETVGSQASAKMLPMVELSSVMEPPMGHACYSAHHIVRPRGFGKVNQLYIGQVTVERVDQLFAKKYLLLLGIDYDVSAGHTSFGAAILGNLMGKARVEQSTLRTTMRFLSNQNERRAWQWLEERDDVSCTGVPRELEYRNPLDAQLNPEGTHLEAPLAPVIPLRASHREVGGYV